MTRPYEHAVVGAELIEASTLVPGDIIHDLTLDWTVMDVRPIEHGVVVITAFCGPMQRSFTTVALFTFHVTRWESRLLQAKQELITRIMGVYSPTA